MCAVCRSVFYPRIVHRTVLIGPLAMGPASWGLLKRRWSPKIACWTPKILLSFWRKSAAGLESSKDFVSAEKVLSQSPKICRCFRTFFAQGCAPPPLPDAWLARQVSKLPALTCETLGIEKREGSNRVKSFPLSISQMLSSTWSPPGEWFLYSWLLPTNIRFSKYHENVMKLSQNRCIEPFFGMFFGLFGLLALLALNRGILATWCVLPIPGDLPLQLYGE